MILQKGRLVQKNLEGPLFKNHLEEKKLIKVNAFFSLGLFFSFKVVWRSKIKHKQDEPYENGVL